MMTRGLSYRNDGADLADAKRDAFKRMLCKYPPDVARVCCERLRPDGWFPSIDKVEIEIIELLKWRNEVFTALLEGEVLTDEQLRQIEIRRLGYKLSAALKLFPIWDNGKEQRQEQFEEAKATLSNALREFVEFCPEPEDFIDRRSVASAEEYLKSELVPYPYKIETAKDRSERLRQRDLEHEQRKAEAIANLEAAIEDDMIAEIEDQKHI